MLLSFSKFSRALWSPESPPGQKQSRGRKRWISAICRLLLLLISWICIISISLTGEVFMNNVCIGSWACLQAGHTLSVLLCLYHHLLCFSILSESIFLMVPLAELYPFCSCLQVCSPPIICLHKNSLSDCLEERWSNRFPSGFSKDEIWIWSA